ncbi:MAG TPA: hypothetical protein PK375_04620 [Rhodocyclaceae bacterium]|nr:hypothetical protein [Rhodocyclaceae bacterium]HNH35171.1 hypothetical protein [Rhodocyclaceae bacterium]
MISRPILLLVVAALSAACEQLGIDDPVKLAAAKEAEARAVGSACRHSGRNLEDCYDTNPKASKAAIFAGWREMDAYMRENKIEVVSPEGKAGNAEPRKDAAAEEDKPAGKEAPPAKENAPAPPPAKKGASAKATAGSGRGIRVTQVDCLDLPQQFG